MQYLAPHSRKPGTFMYSTGDEGLVIEFEIEYRLGGWGGFDWQNRPRGIYIDVTPAKLEKRDGYTSRIWTVSVGGSDKISGGWIFLEPLARLSRKKILQAAQFFDEFAPVVANMWLTDTAAAKKLLFEKATEYQSKFSIQLAA
ncbi:MAG: hypothetical protein ABR924_18780 [Terracidiphilus sp.]